MRHVLIGLCLVWGGGVLACGDSSDDGGEKTSDGGATDGGSQDGGGNQDGGGQDSGATDGGTSASDSGRPDSGVAADAGPDASVNADAGPLTQACLDLGVCCAKLTSATTFDSCKVIKAKNDAATCTAAHNTFCP